MIYWILISKTDASIVKYDKGDALPSYSAKWYTLEDNFATEVEWENRLMDLGIFTETINDEENGL